MVFETCESIWGAKPPVKEKEMPKKVGVNELVERVGEVLYQTTKEDFVDIVNKVLGTEYKVKDIKWED